MSNSVAVFRKSGMSYPGMVALLAALLTSLPADAERATVRTTPPTGVDSRGEAARASGSSPGCVSDQGAVPTGASLGLEGSFVQGDCVPAEFPARTPQNLIGMAFAVEACSAGVVTATRIRFEQADPGDQYHLYLWRDAGGIPDDACGSECAKVLDVTIPEAGPVVHEYVSFVSAGCPCEVTEGERLYVGVIYVNGTVPADWSIGREGVTGIPGNAYVNLSGEHGSWTDLNDLGFGDRWAVELTISTECDTTSNSPPVCDAGGPYGGVVDEPITFDGTGSFDSDGSIAGYDWDFGDGAMGSGPTPTHVYTTPNSYVVTLTVTDDRGAAVDCSTTAEVRPPPTSGELYRYPDLLPSSGSNGSDVGALGELDELGELGALELGELGELRTLSNEPSPPPAASDPVVTSLGEYVTWATDLDLGGHLPLRFARHHGSFVGQSAAFWGFYAPGSSPVGANWVHNHQYALLRLGATRVAIYYQRGMVIFFEKVGPDWQMVPAPLGFTTFRGTPFQLVESGTTLEMMDPVNRLMFTFEFASLADQEQSPLERVRDRSGNTHTLTYNPDGTLALIDDGVGRTLSFGYVVSGAAPRIVSVTDQSGRTVQYGYTGRDLTTVTDPDAKTTQYAYDGASRILAITEPVGNVPIQNAYLPNGRVLAQADGELNVTSFAYGPGATTITDPLGNPRSHLFNPERRLVGFVDEAGNTVHYAYDGFHRRISTTDRLGDTSSLTHDPMSGYVTSRTDNLGNTFTYTYTPQVQDGFTFHVLTGIDYPTGAAAAITYDAAGNVVSFTDREANTWSYTRNPAGQALTVTNPDGGVWTYVYDADATLLSATDPSGNTTAHGYDAAKRPILITRPGGVTVAIGYDPSDNVTSVTDENGHVTGFAYDDNDNLRMHTDPLGHSALFGYDLNDDLTAVTDPLGLVTAATRDGLRRIATITDPVGDVVSFDYDARGRLTSLTDEAGGIWIYTYDAEGVPTSIRSPLADTWTFTSDALGRLTEVQSPLGDVVGYTYDALGRIVRVTDPVAATTNVTRDGNERISEVALAAPGILASYDRNGLMQVASVTDPRGFLWQNPADAHGRVTSESDPLGNQYFYTYDDRSRVSEITLPGGLGVVNFTYDAAGRLVLRSYSDGTLLAYGYDADDRLLTATGTSFAYDAADRLTDCNGLSMTYDADGRLEVLTLAPGKVVTYGYDARGLPVTVTDWVGMTTLTYDSDRRLTSIERPNGVTTAFTYDERDLLIATTEGPGLSSIALTRDARGLITGAVRNVPLHATPALGLTEYEYDPANQVVGASYDDMGRLLDDGTHTYAWDLASRLESYSDGVTPVGFTRDAFGNVLTRSEGPETQGFVWNYALGLPAISVIRDGGVARGSVDRTYCVHTPGGLLLHTIDAGDDSPRFHHFDEVGSTIFLTDGTGAITDSYAYDALGRLLAESGASDSPFTFHGRYGVVRDGHLYSMRARYYDPICARFISRDPLGLREPQSINPYQAFFQNPLSRVDPLGTDPRDLPEDPNLSWHRQYDWLNGGGYGFGVWAQMMGGTDPDELAREYHERIRSEQAPSTAAEEPPTQEYDPLEADLEEQAGRFNDLLRGVGGRPVLPQVVGPRPGPGIDQLRTGPPLSAAPAGDAPGPGRNPGIEPASPSDAPAPELRDAVPRNGREAAQPPGIDKDEDEIDEEVL